MVRHTLPLNRDGITINYYYGDDDNDCFRSIQTLVKISKTAGARLKPHAARLIPALLEALSTLEPQVLNYLSLRATEQEKVKPGLLWTFTES